LTTDQLSIYLKAVDKAFGVDVDYAMLQKIYAGGGDRRTSARLSWSDRTLNADVIPRFTRLTNAFSRKIENHAAAVALYFFWYNFRRVHQTLRVTPAIEADVTDHVWSAEAIVEPLG
jgi:hypothetical protein